MATTQALSTVSTDPSAIIATNTTQLHPCLYNKPKHLHLGPGGPFCNTRRVAGTGAAGIEFHSDSESIEKDEKAKSVVEGSDDETEAIREVTVLSSDDETEHEIVIVPDDDSGDEGDDEMGA
ncbi:hypothetical protein ACKRZS_013269 [Fusarium odoratissimum]